MSNQVVSQTERTQERSLVVLLVGLFMILVLVPTSILSAGLGFAAALVVGTAEIVGAWRLEPEPGAGVLRLLLGGFGTVTLLLGVATWLL